MSSFGKRFQKQRYDDTYIFKEISKLATIVLSMPHSNAEAERIFSVVTDCKTKKRNCLGNDTLSALQFCELHVKIVMKTVQHFQLNRNTLIYTIRTCILSSTLQKINIIICSMIRLFEFIFNLLLHTLCTFTLLCST